MKDKINRGVKKEVIKKAVKDKAQTKQTDKEIEIENGFFSVDKPDELKNKK